MKEAVLDASVILKWFGDVKERQARQAHAIRAAFEQGDLAVVAPPLLSLEIVNIAGRRWNWPDGRLPALAGDLQNIGFEWREPDLARVAHWSAAGLTAYDAAYVSVAEEGGLELVTDDAVIHGHAPRIATQLTAWP